MTSGHESLGISKRGGPRFSFPVIFFIVSLIVSPLIFLSAVAGDRVIAGIARRVHAFKTKVENTAPLAAAGKCVGRHPLDNTCLDSVWENKKIVAVSIDNHVEARPPSGLAKARLVIEAPVEGGITRFLAFFAEGDEVPEIGPIRSARPYFIDWAREFEATLVHMGGSPEALERIKKEGIKTIDGMTNGAAMVRDPKRSAPHSTYSSGEKLFSATAFVSNPQPFLLKKEETAGSKNGKLIRIPAFSSAYEVIWKYDEEKKLYKREGTDLEAKNVLVLRMPIEIIDEIGRRKIETLGTGEAVMLIDGELIAGTWKRDTYSSRTQFLTSNGEEVALSAGYTWIVVVGGKAVLEYN